MIPVISALIIKCLLGFVMSLKNDVAISLRMPNDTAVFFQKLSELWGVSFSSAVRRALTLFKRQYGNQKTVK